jgi:hypothetical protein
VHVNEAGVVGDSEEVVESEGEDQEEQEESSEEEEEEDKLQVSGILSCQYVGATLKYLCQYRGYEECDTSLEPASNIQPKSVLQEFQDQGRQDGTFPPLKPSPKRKQRTASKPGGRKRAKASSSSGAYKTRSGGLKLPNSWVRMTKSDSEEDSELEELKVDEAVVAEQVDLCNSEGETPKAPELVVGVCDYGCPNPDDCILKEATGRFCDAPGCTKRVHHLCLIQYAENPKKPQWYKKFNESHPSGAMCKRCLVAKVAADGRKQIRV